MGLSKASIQDVGTMVPATWASKAGSSRINLTAPGTYTLVPSPPPGKVRLVVEGSSDPWGVAHNAVLPCGVRLCSSDGLVMGVDNPGLIFDVTLSALGGEVQVFGVPTVALWPNVWGHLYLAPGESVSCTVGNFAGGTTKVVGVATWIDFDATDVSFVRLTFPVVNVNQLVVPAVPAGKIAVAYYPGGPTTGFLNATTGYQASFINPDGNTHTWDTTFTDPAGGSLVIPAAAIVGPASMTSAPIPGFSYTFYATVLVQGQSLAVKLNSGDVTPTTPPRLAAMYKLLDSV